MIKKHMITLMFLLIGCGFVSAQEGKTVSFDLKTAVHDCKDERCRTMHEILMHAPKTDEDLWIYTQFIRDHMQVKSFFNEYAGSFDEWFTRETGLSCNVETMRKLMRSCYKTESDFKKELENFGAAQDGISKRDELEQARQVLVDEITSKMSVDEYFIKSVCSVNGDEINTEDHRNAAAINYQTLYERLLTEFQKSVKNEA